MQHHVALVSRPPNITRHKAGNPVHNGPVPAAADTVRESLLFTCIRAGGAYALLSLKTGVVAE
jgi:hypothetical protein